MCLVVDYMEMGIWFKRKSERLCIFVEGVGVGRVTGDLMGWGRCGEARFGGLLVQIGNV